MTNLTSDNPRLAAALPDAYPDPHSRKMKFARDWITRLDELASAAAQCVQNPLGELPGSAAATYRTDGACISASTHEDELHLRRLDRHLVQLELVSRPPARSRTRIGGSWSITDKGYDLLCEVWDDPDFVAVVAFGDIDAVLRARRRHEDLCEAVPGDSFCDDDIPF